MVGYVAIKGYEGYLINKQGEVLSLQRKTPKKIKPYIAGNGYYEVTLRKEKGVYKRVGLHRLLAETFIENPDNKEVVNHIDGNILNYSLDNLEWVTQSENTLHYIYTLNGGNKTSITVDGIKFETLKSCAEHFNISAKNLSSQLAKGIIPKALRGKTVIFK